MRNLSAIIVFATITIFTLLFQSSLVSANDPMGWSILKQTIEDTSFSEVSSLLNRTFDLEVAGATKDYEFTVKPEAAFKVERLESNKFRVTIINPEALVKRELIVEYYPIGWNLGKLDPFKPTIKGETTCLYNVTFSQTGVKGVMDLPKFDTDYDITYELSNPESISSVTRAGKGYDIIRVAKSTSESKIRLRLKKKIGDSNLQTDWILIPVCSTKDSPTPPVTPTPTPTPIPEENPADFLELKIEATSFCEEATGLFCTTLQFKATNTSPKRVRCNEIWFYMKHEGRTVANQSQWIELVAGQTYDFQIVLKAPYKPTGRWSYHIEKTDCRFK